MANPEIQQQMDKDLVTLDKLEKDLDKDPAFKEVVKNPAFTKDPKQWDELMRAKWRKAVEEFSRENPTNVRAAELFLSSLFIQDAESQHQQCIATDDPRLKGN
ncbi:MAG: hypothetical protein JO189_26420 [Deltaproteobacteria bacterium]|nr:hypothetical protein [Deltaproteobacteria bacterium]